MCDVRKGFKLCTCDEEELIDPDWILERRDRTRDLLRIRGKAVPPHFNAKEQKQQRAVLTALNAGEAFDFDYDPVDGDVLELRVGERFMRFIFGGERWSEDTSTSLAGWRGQMVPHLAGEMRPG